MKRSSSGMGLMLIELVVVICFFSVISSVCVKLFVNAKVISDESARRSQAVLAAESAAECFKAAGGDAAETAALLDGMFLDDGTMLLCYDESWRRTEDAPAYCLRMEISEAAGLARAHIAVSAEETDEKAPIFVLEAAAAAGVQP